MFPFSYCFQNVALTGADYSSPMMVLKTILWYLIKGGKPSIANFKIIVA